MRNKFEQQHKLGIIPISEVKLPLKSRDGLPPILRVLQHIFRISWVRLSIILLAVFLTLSVDGGVHLTSSDDGCDYESFEFVMGTDYYAPPKISMPKKGNCITDKNFHTKLARITNKKADGYSGPGIGNEYSKIDPENSDGTCFVLRGNNGTWYLYNALTSKKIKQLTVFNSCGWEEPEPRWVPSNPKIFYYLCDTELKSYNIDTDVSTTIHDFKNDFPSAASITTKTEGDASLDRRYWCFMVQDSDYNLLAVVVYDKTVDKIVGQKEGGFPDILNWVGMSMSGNYAIIGYSDEAIYTSIFSRDFSKRIDLPYGAAGHGDAALTQDGKDVYVYQNVATDYIAMADMETGAETPLVEIPFSINTDIGLHVSGNCSQTPGWVLVSTYGAKKPPKKKRHSWMDTQLFMVELKADPRIWRIAHTHSYTAPRDTGKKNYFAEAFAAINLKGTKIYFGSNWGRFRPRNYTDTYQVILPDNWVNEMPE